MIMKILSINIMPRFYCQITMRINIQDRNMVHRNQEFLSKKHYSVFIIIDIKEF